MKSVWSVRKLAETAGVSISWVHQEIQKAKFPGIIKIGNTYIIPYEEGVAWLKSRGIEIDTLETGEA